MSPVRRSPRAPQRVGVAALAVTALSVAGCGGATRHPQVASLPHPGHARTTTAGGADQGIPDPDGRPRQGLDENSEQQLQALYRPFYRCVYDEHHVASKLHPAAYASSLRRATSACIRLEPLPPWPLDPANPQSRAFIGRTVTCMRAEGYQARAILDPGYTVNPPEWTVVYEPGIDNVSERVLAIQFRCQDRARTESPG